MDDRIRLLMIEFAATRGFHRAELFPFIQGHLRLRHETRWIRFGVEPANLLQFEAAGVDLNTDDTQVLQEALDAFQPTHLLFGLRPSAALMARLTLPTGIRGVRHAGPDAAAPGSDLAPVEGLWHVAHPFPTAEDDVSSMPLIARTVPDHAWEPGNDAARALNPLPYVIAGESCLYERSFSSNPFLAALDLDGCIRSGGCAFCMRPPTQTEAWRGIDSVEAIRVQLDAIAHTCPLGNERLNVRMQGEAPMRHVEAFTKLIRNSDLPPTEFLLDSRSDLLVRMFPALRRALATLTSTPHRIELCLLGIENFCTNELARLNKGFNPTMNLEALRCLFLLEEEFPDCFGFRRHGGLSLITFTPWTRPEELLLNLSVCQMLDISSITGKLLSGRLRLYPTLPLHARALADGLLTDHYDDPLLDTSRLNLYEPEAPWRFADPVMEPISRVLLRIENDQVPRGFDPLTDAVGDLVRHGRKAGVDPVDIARRIVRTAVSLAWDGATPTVEGLLDEGRRFLDELVEPGPVGESWAPQPQWPAEGPLTIAVVPLDCLLAHKPVTKFEPVHPDHVPAWTGNSLLPNVRVEQRPAREGEPIAFEAFFGRKAAEVDEAVEVTMQLHDPTTNQKNRQELIARMGRLLGYPDCCTDAWAYADEPVQSSFFWLNVDRRVATPGPVPFELSPASVEFVPCSLACTPSLPRARALLDGIRRQAAPGVWERHVDRLKRPFLLFSGVQSGIVELIPETEPGERFRFHVGLDMVPHAETADIALADEIIVEGETLLLLRKGRPFLPLSGRAFLWWHERAFQVDFWRAMIAARRAAPIAAKRATPTGASVDRNGGSDAPAAETIDPSAERATEFMLRLCEQVIRAATRFAGYQLITSGLASPGQVSLRFEGGDRPVVLIVDLRGTGAPDLLRIGRMSLRHPEAEPLRTPDQWRAFRSFSSFLRNVLARRAPAART